jgi:hypothetical protein
MEIPIFCASSLLFIMCGQMKTLIDWACSRYTEINNKEFYFIVSVADDGKPVMERTLYRFRGFTFRLNGSEEKKLIYGPGAWKIGNIKKRDAMNKAFEMGKTV